MQTIKNIAGDTDVYLLDQILKGRYTPPQRVLDAGAGQGRNLHWFAQNGFEVYGSDRDPRAVQRLQQIYADIDPAHFSVAPVEHMPYPDAFFDHIICCAVLHFAENPAHFEAMFAGLARTLKPGGSLFLRVATDVGLAHKMQPLGNGRYTMPDGTDRFLLTRPLLENTMATHRLVYLEPFKTVLVDELRSMTVLVLGKP